VSCEVGLGRERVRLNARRVSVRDVQQVAVWFGDWMRGKREWEGTSEMGVGGRGLGVYQVWEAEVLGEEYREQKD